MRVRAVISLAERYASACDEQAAQASGERAEELHQVAAILRRVPAEPSHTLHEALQAIWITQVALHQENNDMALSFGRLDQFLFPLFEADLAAGRLDSHRAGELIGCFFVKMGDHTPLVPRAGHELFGGSATSQAVTIGGMKRDGSDGVNELTYLMLKMSALLALREPNLSARLHANSSPVYRRALLESISQTGAAPALFNDEVIISALTAHGVSRGDACDYGLVGCVEPTSAGRAMGMTGAVLLNLAAVLELAINDGTHPLSGMRIGPAGGHLADFGGFDALWEAFACQLDSMVALACDGNARFSQAHAVLHPTPLLSALIEGTADSGRDVTHGGAKYNSSGVAVIGLADVADSLTALKQVVFDKGRVSAEQVSAALADDFVGHERVRALIRHRATKYGTDDAEADRMVTDVMELIGDTFAHYEAPRGGCYHVGYWSVTAHAGFGALTGSLPNGRRKSQPLASGATPVSGVAAKGPTAALASTAKLPARCMANGIANNHKFSRVLLGQAGKLDLARLLPFSEVSGGREIGTERKGLLPMVVGE